MFLHGLAVNPIIAEIISRVKGPQSALKILIDGEQYLDIKDTTLI
jgi:hypothetical protein